MEENPTSLDPVELAEALFQGVGHDVAAKHVAAPPLEQ
jgi:hypothetical protein